MGCFIKDFLKAALGLTMAIFLAIALQPQIAAGEVIKSGAFLLAQKTDQEKAPAPSPTPLPQKPGKSKSLEPPQSQPEKMQRRTRGIGPLGDEPERAGTKKIGGQSIRAKETPQGE
jgi:hypothetical protein